MAHLTNRGWCSVLCAILLAPGPLLPRLAAQEAAAPPAFTEEQLNGLVAPVALFPDPLLAQVLVAATYPLQIVEAHQWLQQNKAKGVEERVGAAKERDWDPSIQAMVTFDDLLERMAKNIKWTTDLGNAFLDEQEATMDAVQRMRLKAKEAGKLETTPEQTVEIVREVEREVIIIQPANPQVIHVPVYNPVVIWGPWMNPFMPMFWPMPPMGMGMWMGFGMGMSIGMAWGCCGWGWGMGWGRGNVVINNNFFVRNNFPGNNVNIGGGGGNNINIGGGGGLGGGRERISDWRHEPANRQGVPYRSPETADRVRQGAGDRMGGARDRAGSNPRLQGGDGRPQLGGSGGLGSGNRPQLGGSGGVGTGGANRPQIGGSGGLGAGSGNRPQIGGSGGIGAGGANRPQLGGSGVGGGSRPQFDSNRIGGASDRMGNRNIPRSMDRSSGALGSMNQGRASSSIGNRGYSGMNSARTGGARPGGAGGAGASRSGAAGAAAGRRR